MHEISAQAATQSTIRMQIWPHLQQSEGCGSQEINIFVGSLEENAVAKAVYEEATNLRPSRDDKAITLRTFLIHPVVNDGRLDAGCLDNVEHAARRM